MIRLRHAGHSQTIQRARLLGGHPYGQSGNALRIVDSAHCPTHGMDALHILVWRKPDFLSQRIPRSGLTHQQTSEISITAVACEPISRALAFHVDGFMARCIVVQEPDHSVSQTSSFRRGLMPNNRLDIPPIARQPVLLCRPAWVHAPLQQGDRP